MRTMTQIQNQNMLCDRGAEMLRFSQRFDDAAIGLPDPGRKAEYNKLSKEVLGMVVAHAAGCRACQNRAKWQHESPEELHQKSAEEAARLMGAPTFEIPATAAVAVLNFCWVGRLMLAEEGNLALPHVIDQHLHRCPTCRDAMASNLTATASSFTAAMPVHG